MKTTLTKSYRQHTATPSKNRVWIFFGVTSSCTGGIWSQAPGVQQEISGISTLLVSDVRNWLSKDPIGISGGLNQYQAFVSNPINFRDPSGLDIYHVVNPNATAGGGHSAAIVGLPNGKGYTYHSYGPSGNWFSNKDNYQEKNFSSLELALKYVKDEGYTNYSKYNATECEDKEMRQVARRNKNTNYGLFHHNCVNMVSDMLNVINAIDAGYSGPSINFGTAQDLADESGSIK